MCLVCKAIYRARWWNMCNSPFYLEIVPLFLLSGTLSFVDTGKEWWYGFIIMTSGRHHHINSLYLIKHLIVYYYCVALTEEDTIIKTHYGVSPSQMVTPSYKHIILCRPSRVRHHHKNTLYCVALQEGDSII